jgi:hypothetical protein
MKACDIADPAMLAPCGIFCAVCYRHLGRNPCGGCGAAHGNPAHCGTCKMKCCAKERGLSHCFLCGEFPCLRIRRLDKSYRKRYNASPVENGLAAKEMGVTAFLVGHLRLYTCRACGGVISMHDGICSECKTVYSLFEGGVEE